MRNSVVNRNCSVGTYCYSACTLKCPDVNQEKKMEKIAANGRWSSIIHVVYMPTSNRNDDDWTIYSYII